MRVMALGNVSPLLQWVDGGPYCAQERPIEGSSRHGEEIAVRPNIELKRSSPTSTSGAPKLVTPVTPTLSPSELAGDADRLTRTYAGMVNWPALLFSTQKNVTGGAPGSFGVEAPRKRIQEQSDFGPSPKSCYRKLTLTLLPFDNVIPRRTRNQIGFVLKSHLPLRRAGYDAGESA
jgi:hypothetical protein